MRKKVIIIGAGIAGLSAGCYALKNGFDVEIVEKNRFSGGLCRSLPSCDLFEDGFQLLLQGLSPKINRYNIWNELSIESHLSFVAQDNIVSVYQEQGNFLHLSSNLNSLKESFLALSPNDAVIITSFFYDVKQLSELIIHTTFSRRTIVNYFKLKKLQNHYKKPPWKYAIQFQSKILADAFIKALSLHDQSLFSTMKLLVSFYANNCAIPNCSSSQIATMLENEFINRGGRIRYNASVTKILIEKNKACGVVIENGQKAMSDVVISCADGHETLFEWIDKKYLTFSGKEIYKKLEPYPSILLIRVSLKGDFYVNLPSRLLLSFPQGTYIVFSKINTIILEKNMLDNSHTHSKNTVFYIKIPTTWSIWKELKKDEMLYQKMKVKVIENVIHAIDEKFPQFSKEVDYSDIITPIDFYNSSSNWQGSYHGFMDKEKKPGIEIPQNLTFLRHFYMAGHWMILGGGVYAAAKSARNSIKKLCRKNRIPFKT